MTVPLLIITPQTGFGVLVRRGLDSDRYTVTVTADFSEAIHHVRKTSCTIVLLDAELEDSGLALLDIGYALRQIKANIQFILVKRPGQDLDLGLTLNPVATLLKPISLPELNQSLEKLTLSPSNGTAMPAMKPSLPAFDPNIRTLAETSRLVWVKDVSKAAQHLTRLTLESSAQAALITRESELWAYAGQLSREAAQELSTSIQRYWDRESDSDILRFVRLQSTEAQHILYARKLSASMILALVFDGETSFSTIRSQAGKLVKNLADPIEADGFSAFTAPAAEKETLFGGDDADEEDLPPISELLGDVPSPIPTKQSFTQRFTLPWDQPKPVEAGFAPQMAVEEPKTQPPAVLQPPVEATAHYSQESSPVIRRDNFNRPIPAMDETMASNLNVTETQTESRSPRLPDEVQTTRKQVQKDQALIETRPHSVAESVTQVAHRILLEPASPAMADLAYACLLVPRFDTHHLVGDAAERLTEWVPQVCVAFGWRLEYISVRPDYLQWVARVPPSTAPGYVMRIIRQQTSERLFNEFPRFKKENPSGDFWAPGYLIMGSSQPHPQNMVRNHIKQTRERQGLNQDE
jgi:REP element-mobilizing transposase RayT/DNA-binding response OmpR family regulator